MSLPSVLFEVPRLLDWATPEAAPDAELEVWARGGASTAYTEAKRAFHPGPKVTIDVAQLRPQARNVARTASVLAKLRAQGYWPVRRCFDAALARDPSTKGVTRFSAAVIGKGSHLVQSKWLTEPRSDANIKDAQLARCLLAELARVPLNAPGKKLELDVHVEVWPGDAPGSVPQAPALPNWSIFEQDKFLQALEPLRPTFAGCFGQALKTDAALWGRVGLRVIVEVDGTLHQASEQGSHFPSADVVRCMLGELARFSFPIIANRPYTFKWGVRFGAPPAPSANPGETPAVMDVNAPSGTRGGT